MNDETLSNSDIPEAEATAGDAHTEELAQREDDVCAPPKAVAQEEPESDADANAADAGTTVDGDDEEPASESGEESAEVESSEEVSEAEARRWTPVPIPRWAQLPMSARAGWIATWVMTILAAFIRLPGLGTIRTLIFDETYYVKDAYSQIALGYEGSWAKDTDPAFISGDFSGLSAEGGYVVHPSVGKWLIGLGMRASVPFPCYYCTCRILHGYRWHRDCFVANGPIGRLFSNVRRGGFLGGAERSRDYSCAIGLTAL